MYMGCTEFVKILLGKYVQKLESLELFAEMLGHSTFCALHSMAAGGIDFIPQLFVLIISFLVFLFF